MRNALGVLMVAVGAGAFAAAFSTFVALLTFGLLLTLGALLLVIDWDGK